jgi:hypothetical protein
MMFQLDNASHEYSRYARVCTLLIQIRVFTSAKAGKQLWAGPETALHTLQKSAVSTGVGSLAHPSSPFTSEPYVLTAERAYWMILEHRTTVLIRVL